MAAYFNYLCTLLEPLRIYSMQRGNIGTSELYAAGEALDTALEALENAEREGILPLAQGEGLTRREKLFARCPAGASVSLRREAIASLMRINADGFTLSAINSTISGCGIYAAAEETEVYGNIRVRFPDTVGEPENFPQIEKIILDIIPCHLQTEFFFRFLTWTECEAQSLTWGGVEEAEHTWESFQKAVPGA